MTETCFQKLNEKKSLKVDNYQISQMKLAFCNNLIINLCYTLKKRKYNAINRGIQQSYIIETQTKAYCITKIRF